MKTFYGVWACLWICLATLSAQANEDWPCWRGPRGDGSSLETQLPLKWDGSTGSGIQWKVPIPGKGHASPIVVGDSIFVVSCLEETQERILLCLDRKDGAVKWRKTVVQCPLETIHKLNSYASSTPASDGKLVFVTFLEVDGSTVPATNVSRVRPVTPGQIVVAAYDFQGNQTWKIRTGDFVSVHGFCSSPVVYEDLLIVNGDHDGKSYIIALNKKNGQQVWKTMRKHQTRSYCTPIVRQVDGRRQLVFSGSKCITSLDPRSGKLIWEVDGPTEQFVASMVFNGGRFFAAGGYPTHHVIAIDPTGRGNVTDSHVRWHVTNVRCYVPSPVIVGTHLLVADDRGTANCFSTETGDRLWQARMGKHFGASLVTANGLVYFLASDGVMKILRPGPSVDVVAENPLGEACSASPALSRGHIYLRGVDHLFAIQGK